MQIAIQLRCTLFVAVFVASFSSRGFAMQQDDDDTLQAADAGLSTPMEEREASDKDEPQSVEHGEPDKDEPQNANHDEPDTADTQSIPPEKTEGLTSKNTPSIGKDAQRSEAGFWGSLGVYQLPPDAYPEPQIRGLHGGSLWLTFHGLQWPYMKKSGIGLSGTVWLDTGYEKIERGDPNQKDIEYWLLEGRFTFRVTPTYTRGDWFIQGQAELVANKDQDSTQPNVVDADDIWVRLGMWGRKRHNWDVQVGRFEAWELYHFGMGLDLNTLERRGAWDQTGHPLPEIYGVSALYYRPSSGVGNLAVHYYPTDFLRIEALGRYGNDGILNTIAGRGAAILDFGWIKLKGGGEYQKKKGMEDDVKEEIDDRGFGGAVQLIYDPYIEGGLNAGWRIVDRLDHLGNVNEKGSFTTWSVGGFLNARIVEDLLVGGGGNYTRLLDIHEDETGDVGAFSHIQVFGAIQYHLFKQLFIKVVVAWAKADFAPSFTESDPYHNEMISSRIRFMYNF